MKAERDPYRVLGVDPSADRQVIQAAWRVLVKLNHHDFNPSQESRLRMVQINAAWAILRDAASREAWDRAHLATRDGGAGHLATPPPPPPVWRRDGRSGSSGPSGSSGEGQPSSPVFERQPGPAPVGPDGRPRWRRGPGGEGAAGPPPGQPVGTVLPFGRHLGWSLGEVARVDPGYLTWLAQKPEGAPYRGEIDRILRGRLPGATRPLSGNRRRWGRRG